MLRNDCESFKKNKVNQSFSNAIEDRTLGISGWNGLSTLEQSRWPYRQQLCWGVHRGNSTLLTSEPLPSLIWLAVCSQDSWGNSNLWSLLLLEKNVLWKEVTQKNYTGTWETMSIPNIAYVGCEEAEFLSHIPIVCLCEHQHHFTSDFSLLLHANIFFIDWWLI